MQYVPQLQLEMLATGLQSALLVSRSATRGTNIFRMWRDDGYCRLLLRCAARFRSEYCAPSAGARGRPPPGFSAQWAAFHELCRLTPQLRNAAHLLCHLPPEEAPLGQAQPLFV